MNLAAVVPAWNAGPRLGTVIDALAAQCTWVVLVDNGSSDGSVSAATAGRSNVAMVRNAANRGYPAAVNQGLTQALAAGADVIVVANDDAVFQPGAAMALATALADDPRLAATTAKMLYVHRPGVLNGTGGVWLPSRALAHLRGAGEPDDGRYDTQPWVDYPSGAASALAATALRDIGLLDEEYFLYYEDADWGLRAQNAGLRIRYVPAALVLHEGSAGTADNAPRRRYYNVRNRLRCARRHAPARGRAWAWLATAALLAKQPARWVDPRRRRDARAVFEAVADHRAGRYGAGAYFG